MAVRVGSIMYSIISLTDTTGFMSPHSFAASGAAAGGGFDDEHEEIITPAAQSPANVASSRRVCVIYYRRAPSYQSALSNDDSPRGYFSICVVDRSFSLQMNSIISWSTMIRWFTRTVKGFV